MRFMIDVDYMYRKLSQHEAYVCEFDKFLRENRDTVFNTDDKFVNFSPLKKYVFIYYTESRGHAFSIGELIILEDSLQDKVNDIIRSSYRSC